MTSRAHSSSNSKRRGPGGSAEAGLHVLPITPFLQSPSYPNWPRRSIRGRANLRYPLCIGESYSTGWNSSAMTMIQSGTTQWTSRIALYMLHNFHIANPTRPGPPKRLGHRIQCWEEDMDTRIITSLWTSFVRWVGPSWNFHQDVDYY